MDYFFKVWDRARKAYNLERHVKADLEEIYIKIYFQGKVVVRADGASEDIEIVYTQAAQRLIDWMQQKGKENEDLHNMRQRI